MSDATPETPSILPGTDIKHLSVTQVRAYARCARAWAYDRIAKIPNVMPGRVHAGLAMDVALNAYWDARIKGSMTHPDDMKSIYTTTLHKLLTENPASEPDPTAFEDGPRLIDTFVTEPDIINMAPVETQRKLTFDMDGVPFVGYADLITRYDSGLIIADHKFTSRTPDHEKTERSIQLCLYSLAVHNENTGLNPRAVRLISLVRLKTRPKVVVHTHFVTDEQIYDARRFVRGIVFRMKTAHYPMTSPEDSFVCGPKACAYWNICRGSDHGPRPINGEYIP